MYRDDQEDEIMGRRCADIYTTKDCRATKEMELGSKDEHIDDKSTLYSAQGSDSAVFPAVCMNRSKQTKAYLV
jgi:hypothetical protein